MNILFSKANKHIRKLVREFIESQTLSIEENKIIVPGFEVPYNKGSKIGETMTDREILLQIQRNVSANTEAISNGFARIEKDITEIKEEITEIKEDINNIVEKNNLKR